MTKEEKAFYMQFYRLEHREDIKASNKKYCRNNAEKIAVKQHEYYTLDKDGYKSRAKLWRETHPEEANVTSRVWYAANTEKAKSYGKVWRKDNPEKDKLTHRKGRAKRRTLGFFPLNQPFNGCEGHHVDRERVINIPKWLHRSIPHNVFTGQGMEEINALALAYINGRTPVLQAGNEGSNPS